MPEQSYRLTVVACAASWLMVGLHAPVLHQLTHHGRNPGWPMLAVIALLAAAGVATVVALLRESPRGTRSPFQPDARAR
ncbi:MAG TPA: hypothetical protein VGP25_13605 [Gemmatimonadaceae bacterium]|nr:hypothetical protein [Gemmatimonadaceae bacterium]